MVLDGKHITAGIAILGALAGIHARFIALEEAKTNAVNVNAAQATEITRLRSDIQAIREDKTKDAELTKVWVEIAGMRVQVEQLNKQLERHR